MIGAFRWAYSGCLREGRGWSRRETRITGVAPPRRERRQEGLLGRKAMIGTFRRVYSGCLREGKSAAGEAEVF